MRRTDIRFYGVVAILVLIIFLVSQSSFRKNVTDLRHIAKPKLQIFASNRPLHCPKDEENEIKKLSNKYSVTIIVSAHPAKSSVISQTVNSIIAHSEPHLLKEVIISDHGKLHNDHLSLLKREFSMYEPLVRMMSSSSDTRLRTKLLVGHAAQGNIIVYIDDTVVVSQGFLLPLVKELDRNSQRIVIPAFNYITENTFTQAHPVGETKWVFDWKLALHPYELTFQELTSKSESDEKATVVFDDSAFALQKPYLESLGKIKHEMNYLNSIDLSFATWMCGGGAYIVPCSRIGKVTASSTPQAEPRASYKIATQYMTKKYLNIFKKVNPDSVQWTDKEQKDINVDAGLRKKTCPHDFGWLVDNVGKNDIYVPKSDVVEFGKFYSETGSTCFEQKADMIFLGKPYVTECQGKVIEHLSTGQLRIGDECLMISEKGYLVSDVCNMERPEYKWERTSLNQFRTFQNNEYRCISHATDPYPENKQRQVLMYNVCADTSANNVRFQKWNGWTKLASS